MILPIKMKAKKKKRKWVAVAVAAACFSSGPMLRAAEKDTSSTFYEDDAWYDVSEWFDGNDYNPTDEALGRWDDESFSYRDKQQSTDEDNDLAVNYGDFGYFDGDTTDREQDWFYDYYDDGYVYWDEQTFSHYYDIDNDGVYDSYTSYTDINNDGRYEEYEYLTFDSDEKNESATQNATTEQQARSKQQQASLKAISIDGTIGDMKTVRVHDRKHLVANLKTSDDKFVAVDMGPESDLEKPDQGAAVTAKGYALKVGDKMVLLATEAELQGKTIEIDRSGRQYHGTVEKLKTIETRGQQRQLAKLKTEEGKLLLVDLGTTEQNLGVKQGQQLTVKGVPVKLKDRLILLARQIEKSGETTRITRVSQNRR